MPAPAIETVPPSKIAEVKAFLKACAALEELKQTHPSVFRKLLEIASTYTATRDAAVKVVRTRGVTCGPIVLTGYVTSYDAQALLDAVGRQRFAASGGILKPAETVTVDKERFLALVAAGAIEPALAEKIISYAPRYRSIESLSIP